MKQTLRKADFCSLSSVSTPGLLKLIEEWAPFGVSQTACPTDLSHRETTNSSKFLKADRKLVNAM